VLRTSTLTTRETVSPRSDGSGADATPPWRGGRGGDDCRCGVVGRVSGNMLGTTGGVARSPNTAEDV
jgi:hypothetical protein